MTGKIWKFLRLPQSDQIWILRFSLRLLLMEWAAFLFSFKDLVAWIEKQQPNLPPFDPVRTAQLVRIADAAFFRKRNCLRESLVLYWTLPRRLCAGFHIGVAGSQKGFKAHAWVEDEDGKRYELSDSLDYVKLFSAYKHA